jgi:hypothetical protein
MQPKSRAQWPEGNWYVMFTVQRTDQGWLALEFLAWAINNDYRRGGYEILLSPIAPPPYLNEPGHLQVTRCHPLHQRLTQRFTAQWSMSEFMKLGGEFAIAQRTFCPRSEITPHPMVG